MERAAVHVVSSRALSTLPFYLPPKTVHQYPLLFLFLATETMPLDARRRTAAVANYRKKNSKELDGPRYVVGCRSKVDKEKLISATRVVLDMTTLTIMRALPREAFTQHLRVSFRCYAYIPVSGQEYVQLSDCLIETLNKDEVY
uniref:Uncharacterized protein n=1 Tax=Brassica oleracea TaxID=3712 RepID=A0A3P6CPM2_BRAOL|nr:unnamed protein product [Brassica oleracea]